MYFSRDALVVDNAGRGMELRLCEGMRVSFKIYKNNKGFGATEVQDADGSPLLCLVSRKSLGGRRKRNRDCDDNKAKTIDELVEEREVDEGNQAFTGIVKDWNPEMEFGFIALTEEITFNGTTAKEKIFVMKDDIVCSSDKVGLVTNSEVRFKVYKDSRGLGASEVMNTNRTPIGYSGENDEVVKELVKEPKVSVNDKGESAAKRRRKN